MKFTCEKALLQGGVSIASRAVSPKSTIPALEGLLLELRDGMSEFNLTGLDPEDFPELPTVEYQNSFTIPETTMRSMIAQTLFAVSQDESRPVHTGSLFVIEEDHFTLVAVDGFRLALRKEPVSSCNGTFQFVVPGPSLSEVEKICREGEEVVEVHQGQRHVLFKIGETILISRRLEGQFLAWRQAIPRNNPIIITAQRKELLSCIERVSLIVSEKLKSPLHCRLQDGKVDLSTKTAIGEARDCCMVEGDGQGLEIGFNGRYLMEFSHPITPCIIVPTQGEENFLFMVLPVRLKSEY